MAASVSSLTSATLLLHLLLLAPPFTAQSTMQRGSSIYVKDDSSELLFSPDNSFTAGFFKVGTNAYCFAVWFTPIVGKDNGTVVWAANRDQPVNGRGSKLFLQEDGSLVLFNFDDSPVWRADSSFGGIADELELLNTGNLVLKDPAGQFLWESFDNPTDTLLPHQAITKTTTLVSASRKGALFSGYYSLIYDNDNVLRLKYDGLEVSSVYWPNPDNYIWDNGRSTTNSSRFGVLDEQGRFLSSDGLNITSSDFGLGVKRRLTMDFDGNLRIYSLDAASGSWQITWIAMAEACRIHGLCGRNGVCLYTPFPKCSCPRGYERRDVLDWSQGCRPTFNNDWCNNGSKDVKFLELAHTDFYGYDINYTYGGTFDECKKGCVRNCQCEGFQYRFNGVGECYTKGSLFNGYQSPAFLGNIYVKLPMSFSTNSSSNLIAEDPICRFDKEVTFASPIMYEGRKGKSYGYLYWFVSSIGAVEALFILSGYYYLYRDGGVPNSLEQGYRAISRQFRRFTYAELRKATKKFKEELGKGGSGSVYKGVLKDARVVAVKKLANLSQGEEEFWAEVSTIGTIYHMNLVRMWGYCSEAAHKLLVYEYVENGSLSEHLFTKSDDTKLIGWAHRFKIAVGTAKGLAYLHEECLEWVIHCDVKPENILLDSDFEPKISDFGLAKLSRRGGFASNVSRMRGTKGYMAPEWASNLPITAKVDVYSYGVVLLEIVKGRRLSNRVLEGEKEEVELRRIIGLARSEIEVCGDWSWIDEFIDQRLNAKYNKRQAMVMIKVALSCIDEDMGKRPSMEDVVQSLCTVEEEQIPSTVLP